MANEVQAAQPIKVATVEGLTNNNITGLVYITGQLSSTAEEKAKEISILMQSLLSYGIFLNVMDAAKNGIPTGTFVIINDPSTPAQDFSVEVVPYLSEKRVINGGDFEVIPKN
jgi:hypothetical protein